jgi:hypothetical protein
MERSDSNSQHRYIADEHRYSFCATSVRLIANHPTMPLSVLPGLKKPSKKDEELDALEQSWDSLFMPAAARVKTVSAPIHLL